VRSSNGGVPALNAITSSTQARTSSSGQRLLRPTTRLTRREGPILNIERVSCFAHTVCVEKQCRTRYQLELCDVIPACIKKAERQSCCGERNRLTGAQWGWSEPILAVADGEITEVVDEFPDNTPRVLPPVTLDNIAGNHIILRIALNRFVTYAHLQRGSIKVRTGDHVHRGDVLAFLGNSGNTTGAHLHLQVTDRDSVLQSQGVPFVFTDFIYLGPGADYPEKLVSVPWLNSIPPGDGVVKFEAVKK
jgi:hypothetical protein